MTFRIDLNNSLNASELVYQIHSDWILPVTFNVILLFITLFILFSMTHYGVKTGKWKRNHAFCIEKLNGDWVYTLALVLA